MSSRTIVLGGGFGGIAAAVELRRLLGDDHDVVLVDRNPDFTMGLRKLWGLIGHGQMAEGSRPRELLSKHGVEFVKAEVTAIDPDRRGAQTSDGWLEGDHLVVALGAVSRPDLVPGLAEPQRAWLVLAMASTLAGNLTVLGSVANLIVVESARGADIHIGFGEYCRVGVPLTLLTLAMGWLVLTLLPI